MKKTILCLIFFGASSFGIPKVLFLGDSLTDGYGIDHDKAFPAIVAERLKRKGKPIEVINAGEPGATSASGPKRLPRFDALHPTILVLALGANDGLRGIAAAETEKNLNATIDLAKSRKMAILLAGIQIPTNYGKEYREQISRIFPKIAKKHHIALMPFLLEGVGGQRELNQSDGIHPNEKGHEKIAERLLGYLEPLL